MQHEYESVVLIGGLGFSSSLDHVASIVSRCVALPWLFPQRQLPEDRLRIRYHIIPQYPNQQKCGRIMVWWHGWRPILVMQLAAVSGVFSLLES